MGAPALLIHCMLAHSGAFAGVMARLDGLAMRAMDLPGHGGTGYDPGMGFQAQAAANALGVLDGWGAAHLIGHSFGATVALRVAVARPELVRSLALIEPVSFGFLADAGNPVYGREAAEPGAAVGDLREAAAAFVGRWGSGAVTDYMEERMPLVAASRRDLLDGAEGRVRLGDLDGLATPLLLMAGSQSPPVIAAVLDTMAARLPMARRVAITGAGHMAPVTHPEAVSGALRDFLRL